MLKLTTITIRGQVHDVGLTSNGDSGQVHDIGLTSHVLRNKIGLVGGQKVKKSKAAGDAAAATNALIL